MSYGMFYTFVEDAKLNNSIQFVVEKPLGHIDPVSLTSTFTSWLITPFDVGVDVDVGRFQNHAPYRYTSARRCIQIIYSFYFPQKSLRFEHMDIARCQRFSSGLSHDSDVFRAGPRTGAGARRIQCQSQEVNFLNFIVKFQPTNFFF